MKPQRKGRAICRYYKKRHQGGHELTSHIYKGCPKKPARQDDFKLQKEPIPLPSWLIPHESYRLDIEPLEDPCPLEQVKIDTGFGSYIQGLPEFKLKAILQRLKPTLQAPPPPSSLIDIIQAAKILYKFYIIFISI